MTDDPQQSPASPLSMAVTVSARSAFVPAITALAARAGEYAGCAKDEARTLGEAVGQALAHSCRHLEGTNIPARFNIVFEGNDRRLSVDLACTAPLPAGVSLEDVFGGVDGLNGLRTLVDGVEFGSADGRPYCRLTRHVVDSR